MLYRLQANDVSVYPGNYDDLADWIGSLSPDQQMIIESLADTATNIVEKRIGSPLGKRSIRYAASRGESELNDVFNRAWLSSGANFSGTGNINQWLQLPCMIESIQSVTLTSWGTDPIQLTNGTDYVINTDQKYPRIVLSYPLYIQDFFYKYSGIIIDFTGGIYEVDGSVPKPLITAINYLTKGMFENRGDGAFDPDDNGFKFLIGPYQLPDIAGDR